MTFNKLRNLVTGGAGFLGSHLIDKLMDKGEEVICIDNYSTGKKSNILHWFNWKSLYYRIFKYKK